MDLDEIRDEVPILEVLAEYGAAPGARSYWAEWQAINCPFCGDTNGSGSVNVSKGLYLCHQCGAPRDGKAGDVVNIVMDQESLDFKEAIEWLTQTFLR